MPGLCRCTAAVVPIVLPGQGAVAVPLAAAASYDGVTRAMVLAHKERGRFGLARPLGAALADAVVVAVDHSLARDDLPPRRLHLVPVPSRRAAVRSRGHDSIRVLACEAARVISLAGGDAQMVPLLRSTGSGRDQVGLSAVQRRVNVAGAFIASPSAPRDVHEDALVVVVDDITTSGATIESAIRALNDAGRQVGAAAVVAHRERHADTG